MFHKSCLILITFVFILFTIACSTTKLVQIEEDELTRNPDYWTWITEIVTIDGEVIEFAGYQCTGVRHSGRTGLSTPFIDGNGALLIDGIITGVLEDGTEVSWLTEDDPLFWYTSFPEPGFDEDASLRDTILISLPRPPGALTAKLLVNASNTIWASLALKKVIELQGNQTDLWYNLFAMGLESGQMEEIALRQEVFLLNVAVRTGDSWTNAGVITGGGHLTSENRVIPLDLTGIDGDTLLIRLTPPVGFWKLNWIAVDYSEELNFSVHEVQALAMTDEHDREMLDHLSETDGIYYDMPETGNWAELEFPVPEGIQSLERTVYAMVSGYYDIHLDPDAEFRPDLIARIMTEPGFLYRFTADECNVLIAEQQSRVDD
ncbi:MAG: hypothetical protein ABFR50_11165 [Candidatus Fermentibacteria bacterium]